MLTLFTRTDICSHFATQPLQLHKCTMGYNPITSVAPYWFALSSPWGNHGNRCLITDTRQHGTAELSVSGLGMTVHIRQEHPFRLVPGKAETNCFSFNSGVAQRPLALSVASCYTAGKPSSILHLLMQQDLSTEWRPSGSVASLDVHWISSISNRFHLFHFGRGSTQLAK